MYEIMAAHENNQCIFCWARLLLASDETECEECGEMVCASCHVCPDCTPEDEIHGHVADAHSLGWYDD